MRHQYGASERYGDVPSQIGDPGAKSTLAVLAADLGEAQRPPLTGPDLSPVSVRKAWVAESTRASQSHVGA